MQTFTFDELTERAQVRAFELYNKENKDFPHLSFQGYASLEGIRFTEHGERVA